MQINSNRRSLYSDNTSIYDRHSYGPSFQSLAVRLSSRDDKFVKKINIVVPFLKRLSKDVLLCLTGNRHEIKITISKDLHELTQNSTVTDHGIRRDHFSKEKINELIQKSTEGIHGEATTEKTSFWAIIKTALKAKNVYKNQLDSSVK